MGTPGAVGVAGDPGSGVYCGDLTNIASKDKLNGELRLRLKISDRLFVRCREKIGGVPCLWNRATLKQW